MHCVATGGAFRQPFRSQVPLRRGPVRPSQRQAPPGSFCIGNGYKSHAPLPPLRARRTAVTAAFESSDGDGTVIQPDPEEAQQAAQDATGLTRRQLWFAAIKPPMYTVCIIPVLVRPPAMLVPSAASSIVQTSPVRCAGDTLPFHIRMEALCQQCNMLRTGDLAPSKIASARSVQVAAALAYHQTGVFAVGRYLTLTLASICIIAWLNLR